MYISVIVPLYKGKKYIPSILEQIKKCRENNKDIDIEVILVNDYPEENIEVDCSLIQFNVKIINSEINRGIHGARVLGLDHARGEFVLFLDQDDLIASDYFNSQLKVMKDADATVCNAIHNKKPKYDTNLSLEEAATEQYMLSIGNGIVSPGQVLLRKSAISDEWKKHILKNNGADDWFLWICMFNENKKITLNSEILYEHIVDGNNASWQSVSMLSSEQEMIKIIKEYQILDKEKLQILENTFSKLILQRMKDLNKFRKMFFIYDSWIKMLNQEKTITQYLKKKSLKNVAIYGAGYLGKQLYQELKKNNINICYFIDINAANLQMEIPVYLPSDSLAKVDMIIVTLVENEESVEEMLKKKMDTKVKSISQLIEDISVTDMRGK